MCRWQPVASLRFIGHADFSVKSRVTEGDGVCSLTNAPGRSMATARQPALARVSRVPMLSQFSEEKRMP